MQVLFSMIKKYFQDSFKPIKKNVKGVIDKIGRAIKREHSSNRDDMDDMLNNDLLDKIDYSSDVDDISRKTNKLHFGLFGEKNNTSENLVDKVNSLYDSILKNVFFADSDFELETKSYSSQVILPLLNYFLKGNTLFVGEYGFGKTTLSEIIVSILDSQPIDFTRSLEIRGNPEITEEKIIGRPDLASLNEGKEKVIWNSFVVYPDKIIDEINRMPGIKQNLILEGVDKGYWKYLSDVKYITKGALFATVNYRDEGNFEIIPPLRDRFDIAVEAKFPGVDNIEKILKANKSILSNSSLAEKMLSNVIEYNDPSRNTRFHRAFSKTLKTYFPLFNDEEKEEILKQINSVKYSKDAMNYFKLLTTEFNLCPFHGQKRSVDDCNPNCPFHDLACGVIQNSGSRRLEKSIYQMSKAIAWLQKKDSVDVSDVVKVAPYSIWKRISFTPEYLMAFTNDRRTDPLELYVSKRTVGFVETRYENMKAYFDHPEEHKLEHPYFMFLFKEKNHEKNHKNNHEKNQKKSQGNREDANENVGAK